MTDPSLSNPATPPTLERRLSLFVILGGIALWCATLAWLPARFQGYDDAKYLGIGLNVLDGLGPTTVFGAFFDPHSPLWPLILAVPYRALGVDAFAWAHLLGILSSGAVLGMAGWFGWRVRPAVGGFAVASLLAFPYLFELSRRLGLDLPVAALTLGYLLIGGIAIRRGSARWGIATGLTLGVGFLIKESILPLAPVPFLVAIAAARPGTTTARVAAWTVLVAAVVTSWWWWVFAAETGRVYRLGSPAWTLAALAVAVAIAFVAGLNWDRVTRPFRGRLPAASPRLLGWGLATAWVIALTVFFNRTGELLGRGLFDPVQIGAYVRTWFDQLRPVIAIGGIGAALELGARLARRGRGGPRTVDAMTDEVWLALFCSLPFVLLVVGVGELPRHYIAQIALLAVVGASGWLSVVDATARRPTPARLVALVASTALAAVLLAPLAAGRRVVEVGAAAMVVLGIVVVIGIGARAASRKAAARTLRAGGAVVLALALIAVAATGSLVARTVGTHTESEIDVAKAQAVTEIDGWIRANLPSGSTVAFGAALAQEAAVGLRDDYDLVQVRETVGAQVDPDAPLGIAQGRGGPADDWIAMMANPSSARAIDGYRASTLASRLRETGTDAWVQVGSSQDDQPLVVDAALTPEHGFTTGAHWSWPAGDGSIDATVYLVDPARLGFDDTVWVSAGGLERLVDGLERDHGAGAKAAAANLAARVKVHPDDARGPALMERLRRLAAS